MRAKILDPAGPPWARFLPFFAGLVCVVAAPFLPVAWLGLLVVASSLWHFSPFLLGRRAARDAELVLGAGRVEVKNAGLLSQRIRARDIHGASTARAAEGVSVTLQRTGRADHAIELIVPNDEAAREVRETLGIGHHGFGALTWPVRPGIDVAARIAGWLASLAILGCVAASDRLGEVALMVGWVACIALTATTAVIGANLVDRAGIPCIVMRGDGLHVRKGGRWHHIPYALIAGVTHDRASMTIAMHGQAPLVVPILRASWTHRSLSDQEVELLTAQILSAAQRAHGAGPEKPEVAARVDMLARGADPPSRWLARVDATAASAGGGAAGYRAGSALDEQDLWRTLRDPEAAVDLRAGAARALVRIAPDTAPERVEAALSAIRDKDDARRIRVALLPDIEEASRELEELEQKAALRAGR